MASPTFRALDRTECDALLDHHTVGRMAYTVRGRPAIEPIHYVRDGEWLYGRTSQGSKLTALAHHPWVAFEVDEVRDTFDWSSVIVEGTVYRFRDEGPKHARDAYARAVAALRALLPATLTDHDPVPDRQVVFGIHVDSVTGRAASMPAR